MILRTINHHSAAKGNTSILRTVWHLPWLLDVVWLGSRWRANLSSKSLVVTSHWCQAAPPVQMNSSAFASASGTRKLMRSSWSSLTVRKRVHTMQTAPAGKSFYPSWKSQGTQRLLSTATIWQNHVLAKVAWFNPSTASTSVAFDFLFPSAVMLNGCDITTLSLRNLMVVNVPNALPPGREHYTIRPKAMEMHFSWSSPNTNQLKYTGMASPFPEKAWCFCFLGLTSSFCHYFYNDKFSCIALTLLKKNIPSLVQPLASSSTNSTDWNRRPWCENMRKNLACRVLALFQSACIIYTSGTISRCYIVKYWPMQQVHHSELSVSIPFNIPAKEWLGFA